VDECGRDDLSRIVSYVFPLFTTSHESFHGKVSCLCSHLRYDPDLSFAFSTYLVFFVMTGSVVLVSPNVDPVLYSLYPFIWITQLTSFS
jgi:hypothetical protein